jgi:predicted metal-dependent hydrolase
MQKPLAAVDFVVTHELCHLKHFAHNKSFYRMLDRVMPDWRERERLLSRDDAVLQLDLF